MRQEPSVTGHMAQGQEVESSAGAQFTFFLVFNSGAQGTVLWTFRVNLPISGNLIYKCIQSHSEVCFLGASSFCQVDHITHHHVGRSQTTWIPLWGNSEATKVIQRQRSQQQLHQKPRERPLLLNFQCVHDSFWKEIWGSEQAWRSWRTSSMFCLTG